MFGARDGISAGKAPVQALVLVKIAQLMTLHPGIGITVTCVSISACSYGHTRGQDVNEKLTIAEFWRQVVSAQ